MNGYDEDGGPRRSVSPSEREALTLKEAAMLGFGSERVLREMIATGQIKRSVMRIGARGVRLLRRELVDELRERN